MLAILGGGTVVFLCEKIAEMGGGVKGEGIGNVGNAVIRVQQEGGGVMELFVHHEFMKGHARGLFDHAVDVVGVIGKHSRHGIVLNVLGDVSPHVAHDLRGGVRNVALLPDPGVSHQADQDRF